MTSRRKLIIGAAMALAATVGTQIPGAHAALTDLTGHYNISTFASPFTVPGLNQHIIPGASDMVSAPDDIAVTGNNVYIGWGDNVASDGGDGGQSVVAQYSLSGQLQNYYTVTGHVEGLAMGAGGMLYTDENEDGNSALTVIDTATGGETRYGYPNPSVHGGGFDGLQYINGNLYASGSNPDNGGDSSTQVNSHPVIYQVTADPNSYPHTATAMGILWGNDPATNKATGSPMTLNVFDPDSLNQTPTGDLLLSNESGASLTDVANPGTTSQTVTSLSLYSPNGSPVNTDDTGFATSTSGTLLVADVKNNTVYAITAKNGFTLNQAFSSDKTNQSLDMLNFSTGLETPIITGFGGPAGIGFIPDPAATPEPAAVSLMGLGAAMLLIPGRKSRRGTK